MKKSIKRFVDILETVVNKRIKQHGSTKMAIYEMDKQITKLTELVQSYEERKYIAKQNWIFLDNCIDKVETEIGLMKERVKENKHDIPLMSEL